MVESVSLSAPVTLQAKENCDPATGVDELPTSWTSKSGSEVTDR